MKGLILTVVGITGLAIGGTYAYKKWGNTAENDTNAAIKLGFGAASDYVPQLPIHPRSVPNKTNATYTPVRVSKKYKDGIVLARNTDYLNPGQLYATTGPTGLQPTRVSEHSIKDRSATLV